MRKGAARSMRQFTALLAAGMLGTISTAVAAQSRDERIVVDRIDAVLDTLEESGDFDRAEQDLTDLFDSVIGYVRDNQDNAFREAAFALRLVRQLGAADPALRADLFRYLRGQPDFARALVYLVKAQEESPREVYALVDRLRRERGEKLEQYPNLAAAIAVVHDRPLARNINENRATAPDPIALFDFYVAHEDQLFFGVTSIPAELLVYVVDATAELEDLEWAVDRYEGDSTVGARFFDIEYDYDHYRTGAPKKSTLAGWGLPNILRYGGVCADQAYFAVTIGKAIGVPTAYTIGKSADVGHAWVGFLQSDRRQAWWNFSAGRYGAYLGLKGIILDPQTRQIVDDSRVSLLADFALSKKEDRFAVAAFTDASLRLRALANAGVDFAPALLVKDRRARLLRAADVDSQLLLLETGLKHSPGYAPAWFAVRDLAQEGKLSLAAKKKWAGVLDRLCGQKFPDFSLSVLLPMIESVDDLNEQNKLWNAAFRNYQRRNDLAAEIRMAQGKMWEEAGEVAKAGQAYMDVIERYANAGPFVVDALGKAEQLLVNSGQSDRILILYDQTWRRIKRPDEMAGMFTVQSNWYRVGMALAAKLEAAGMVEQAQQVRTIIRGG